MSKRSRGRSAATTRGGLAQLLAPRVFKALGDPRRVALLVRLAEGGAPRTVGDLARGSSVDLSVVSRHLAILRDAGIIHCAKRGKEVWCAVQAGSLARVLRELADALDACCPRGPAAAAGTCAGPGRRRRTQEASGGPPMTTEEEGE